MVLRFLGRLAGLSVLVLVGMLAVALAPVLWRMVFPDAGSHPPFAKTQISEFKTAINIYELDNHGKPPTTAQGLQALIQEPGLAPVPRHWKKYLDVPEIPKDPWGGEYHYSSPGPHGEAYFIASYGADGKPGGEGEDADITSEPSQADISSP